MVSKRLQLQTAALVLAAAGLSACSGSSSGQPSPTPSVTSSTPSPSPSLTVAQQLEQLAQQGTKAEFHATYLVAQKHPASHATWQVWRASTSLRVDVVTKSATATLIHTPRATYACRRSGHHKTCFRVAKKNQPVPTPFRLLAERLFSDSLTRLADRPHSYTVSAPAAGSVHVATSGGTCFNVKVAKNRSSDLSTATYCLSTAGVVTAVVYPSGNVVRVEHLRMTSPSSGAFRPYSSPTPLPS